MRADSAPAVVSLLKPDLASSSREQRWQPNNPADLGLDLLISTLNVDGKHDRALRDILMALDTDPDTIRYRQEILDDLMRIPSLLADMEGLLPLFFDLAHYSSVTDKQALPFQRTLARLGELELYLKAVALLADCLNRAGDGLQSRGLTALRDLVQARLTSLDFARLQRELPQITEKIRELRSITLGINLDHNLKPIGATLLSINTESFKGAGLFKRLFGDRAEFQGIAELHAVPMKTASTIDGILIGTQERADPMLYPLFKDLDGIIADTVRPVETALKSFLNISSRFLTVLEPEIVFYVGAVRLITDMQRHGMPMCRPQILDIEARICQIRDCFNLHLAIRQMDRSPKMRLADTIVSSDVTFDDEGRILIITGPNQGGKTTYIQAMALAQIMAQAGLYVPGSAAEISPVDGIYTHFPVEEKPNTETGRFGEEAQRLNTIFRQATRHSLILLNESLSSTAAGESLYLARDIVRCFRLLGARAAYTTHLHELAASVDAINAETPGDSRAVSIVAVAQADTRSPSGDIKRMYKFVVSPPMGKSYAQELAARYGISFDKIVEILAERHVISPS